MLFLNINIHNVSSSGDYSQREIDFCKRYILMVLEIMNKLAQNILYTNIKYILSMIAIDLKIFQYFKLMFYENVPCTYVLMKNCFIESGTNGVYTI